METVRNILQAKGSEIWSIAPQTSVYEALQLMADKDIGALVVVDGGNVVGVFSERDYARKVVLLGRTSHEVAVAEIMTHPVLYVEPDQTIQDCMVLMTEKRVRHLPVMDHGQLAGIVTIGDVVKALISEQAFRIEQLENYVWGTGFGE
jgi:CBS domain-containing protein